MHAPDFKCVTARTPVHEFPLCPARFPRDKHILNHVLLKECNDESDKISTCKYNVSTIFLGERCAFKAHPLGRVGW